MSADRGTDLHGTAAGYWTLRWDGSTCLHWLGRQGVLKVGALLEEAWCFKTVSPATSQLVHRNISREPCLRLGSDKEKGKEKDARL
jgi:hypothetical protein